MGSSQAVPCGFNCGAKPANGGRAFQGPAVTRYVTSRKSSKPGRQVRIQKGAVFTARWRLHPKLGFPTSGWARAQNILSEVPASWPRILPECRSRETPMIPRSGIEIRLVILRKRDGLFLLTRYGTGGAWVRSVAPVLQHVYICAGT